MKKRIERALCRVGCGRAELAKASHELFIKKRDWEVLGKEVRELEAWVAFHSRTHGTTYHSFKIYRIDDGERHWVVAESAHEALTFHANEFGYEDVTVFYDAMGVVDLTELPPDFALLFWTENGDPLIKSCAEWALVANLECLGSTCY